MTRFFQFATLEKKGVVDMFYYMTLPFASFYDWVRKAFTGLFPLGGGWSLLATGLFFLLVIGMVYVAFRILVQFGKRDEQIKAVAGRFTYFHIAAGVYADIIMLSEPTGGWNVIAHIVYIGWLLAFLTFLVKNARVASQVANAQHGQVYYCGIGIFYGITMFVLGMYAFMTIIAAIIMAICIVFVASFCGAGVRASLLSAVRGSGGGGTGGAERTATLEDGTVIKESGTTWYAENGNGTYRQNFDGSFTRES